MRKVLLFLTLPGLTITMEPIHQPEKTSIHSLPIELTANILIHLFDQDDFIEKKCCAECGLFYLKPAKNFLSSCKKYYESELLSSYLYHLIYNQKQSEKLSFINCCFFAATLQTKGCYAMFKQQLKTKNLIVYTKPYIEKVFQISTDYFDFKTVAFLMKIGIPVNDYYDEQKRPTVFNFFERLNYKSHNPPYLLVLLKAGINPNCADSFGKTPLMIMATQSNISATKKRVLEHMRLLLECKAQTDRTDKLGRKAIDYAHGIDTKFLIKSIFEKHTSKRF